MKILQFAFGTGATNSFLPHNFSAYTGTHDNETARAWLASAPETSARTRCAICSAMAGFPWALIRAAASVADTAVVPLQDVLEQGDEGRMNLPGRASGNWGWRFRDDEVAEWRLERLAEMAELYGRADDVEAGEEPPAAS